MKYLILVVFMGLSVTSWAIEENRIYMIGKIKILETTHTKVVLFHDKGITSMTDCQREIQRGVRGQWRYHHHKFDKPKGYMQRVDYYCVQSNVIATPWYSRDAYNTVYKIDIRNPTLRITREKSYSSCLHSVRKEVRDETSKFFCAKLNQQIRQ